MIGNLIALGVGIISAAVCLWCLGRAIYLRGEAHGWHKGFAAGCELHRPRMVIDRSSNLMTLDELMRYVLIDSGTCSAVITPEPKRRDH